MADNAYNRTWQHKVPKVGEARTRTEEEVKWRGKKKLVTTTKPPKRKP